MDMDPQVKIPFEKLFNSSFDGHLILHDKKVLSCNDATAGLFRMENPSEMIGKDPFRFSPEFQENGERSSVMAKNYISEALTLGNSRFEWLHRIDSGDIWTEYVIDKIENEGVIFLLAVVREIGDFKKTQLATKKRIEQVIAHNQAITELSALENDLEFSFSRFKQQLLEIALNTLGVTSTSIWWKKDKKLKKDVEQGKRVCSFDLGNSIRLGKYPRFEKSILDHQLVVINDGLKDPRSNEFKSLIKQGCDEISLLFVPIVSRNEFLGMLWIENSGSIRKWKFEEQTFATSLGEMLAKQVGSTLKQKVERKLEQSEKVFKALVNHSLDMVCIINNMGIITYQSPSFQNILGFNPNELLGKRAFDFVHKDDLNRLKVRFLRLLTQPGMEDSFVYQIKHKNGSWVYVEALASNQLDQAEIDGIVVNLRDITERIQFQNQLQEQELYYRTLIEKSLELTVIRNREGTITYASPSVDLVFGLKESDLIGKRDVVQTHPGDLEQFIGDWKYLLEHPERPIRIDQRIILPDGKIRHVEGMARNLLDVQPVNGVVMNFRDVTSRKKAENALIESQMRLEGIISSAQDAIITVDSDQNIVLFNNAAEKMFGHQAFDVFGKHMELLIPEDMRAQHRKHIRQFHGSERDQQKMGTSKKQLYGLRKTGSLFPIDASISKQVIEEEVFFTTVIRDITEQIKSEQVLKEYNKTLEKEVEARTRLLNQKNHELNRTLEELKSTQEQLVESEKMASLGQLTAGIAHEINNPINFVTSTISPLKRDLQTIRHLLEKKGENKGNEKKESNGQEEENGQEMKFLFDEITQLLGGIEEGAKRTKNIVLGLRNFSRLDEESFKKTNLHDGLDSTLMLLNSKLRGHIDVKKDYGNIPVVECLPGKINQVFMNILSNAIQAIKGKGEISISTKSTKLKKGHVVVSISDSGKGMTEDVRKRIFEPFFTTKDVGIGTGLGLSISYGIIENHGGSILAKSQPGKGTTFVISLPVSHL